MDPKLSGLDPKLQDAYQRVMNGPTTPPGGGTNQPQTPLQTQTTPKQPVGPQTPNASQPQTIVEPAGVSQTQHPLPIPEQQNQPEPAQNPAPLSQSFNQSNDFHPPQPTAPPSPDLNSYSPPYSGFNTSAPQQPQVPDPTPLVGASNNVAYNADNTQIDQTNTQTSTTTVTKKKGSSLLPLIVGLLIIFLLGAYTFVWIMIFDLKIPFIT